MEGEKMKKKKLDSFIRARYNKSFKEGVDYISQNYTKPFLYRWCKNNNISLSRNYIYYKKHELAQIAFLYLLKTSYKNHFYMYSISTMIYLKNKNISNFHFQNLKMIMIYLKKQEKMI